jgi:DNA-binding transcriptional ArsR family regulator
MATTGQRADRAFQAAGDGVRREILHLLLAGERSAGEIAGCFAISWPAVSRHLRVLREAELVTERRHGRARLYALNRPVIRQVFGGWVAAFDAMWEENLASLKRHVENQVRRRGTP